MRIGLAILAALVAGSANAACVDPDSDEPADIRRRDAGDPVCEKVREAPAKGRALTAAEQAAVAAAVRDKMKDPESARFKWLPMRGSWGAYCALVNGRNSFGGYVGFRPFMAFLAGVEGRKPVAVVLGIADDPTSTSSAAIVSRCAAHGYDF